MESTECNDEYNDNMKWSICGTVNLSVGRGYSNQPVCLCELPLDLRDYKISISRQAFK